MMLEVALIRMGTEFDFPSPLPSLGSLGNASTMSTLGSTCLLQHWTSCLSVSQFSHLQNGGDSSSHSED